MSSSYGENIKINVFGQSHSAAIGVNIDGFPAGMKIDSEKLAQFMARRAPGRNEFSTPRKEADEVTFLSGVTDGHTNGAPICAVIYNTNQRPTDYKALFDTPRPGHADYTAKIKFSAENDPTGGGHFSGRLTAPLCIAGGLCQQLLEQKGITVGAHIAQLHGIDDERFNKTEISAKELQAIKAKPFPCIDDEKARLMQDEILKAKANKDSVGGIIECAVIGLPVGIGGPLFGGIEGRLSLALFGIPAVKGVEFGAGFGCATLYGSENNDEFYYDNDGIIKTATNNCGGILGGISNGMPITFACALKPTPSIGREQNTVSLATKTNTKITVGGRHDPCIIQRAVPVVEAVAAITITDMILGE